MVRREIKFGVIGCGLMGREFASASARWCHLLDLDYVPIITAVCDPNPSAITWFTDNFSSIKIASADYRTVLESPDIDAIYCSVPHNLHEQLYTDIIRAGKHLLGEKPFGMDFKANEKISQISAANPNILVRCASEFPFFPGAQKLFKYAAEGRMGTILDVQAGFFHCSDLDPRKPMNWKRRVATNGAYGCMGDLGMHVLHLPLRLGWFPKNVRAVLSNIVKERPGQSGALEPCETWDNAALLCEVETHNQHFPMTLEMKRIAPGEMNTWFIRVMGTECSAEFSTKYPKTLRTLPYAPGQEQYWRLQDIGIESAYPSITGSIFEFGFSDSILQMWAAFCDELVHMNTMKQPFHCVTPAEATLTHQVFSAALKSNTLGETVPLRLCDVS